MPPAPAPAATASIDIDASPEEVYALLTDLGALAEIGEEVVAHRWLGKTKAAVPGAKFIGMNKNRFYRWGTVATITEAAPATQFGFHVAFGPIAVSHWRYDITPAGEGCRVTESTWDRRPRWFTAVGGLTTGVKERASHNQRSIEGTLRKLKARAEANPR